MGPARRVARLPKGWNESFPSHFPPSVRDTMRIEVGELSGLPGPETERGHRMRGWIEKVTQFLQAEDGPTAVEYAVMLALIIVVCITAITALGTNANKTFSSVSNTIGSTAS